MKPKRTVLVVDDNPVIRQKVREQFLRDGYSACAEAADGQEAIKVAGVCKPDIIILDFSMPVMNGIQAAPALKVIAPNAPIILFTLFAAQMKTMDLPACGISATVSKTESLDKLLDKADQLLAQN